MNHPIIIILFLFLSQFFFSTCYGTEVVRTSNGYKSIYRRNSDGSITEKAAVMVPSSPNGTGLVRQLCSFTYQYYSQYYTDKNGNGLQSVYVNCKCSSVSYSGTFVLQGENVSPCVQNCFFSTQF